MGLGIKIGGLSLDKIVDVAQVAELAIKTQVPLTNLAVCTKLAESIFYGELRRNLIEKNFPALETPLDIFKPDTF